jgi:hypothetical protein
VNYEDIGDGATSPVSVAGKTRYPIFAAPLDGCGTKQEHRGVGSDGFQWRGYGDS